MNPGRRQLRLSRWLAAFILFLGVFPLPARAHTAINGMGEFVSGLIHPLTTPSHVLILLGLGLMIGQHTPMELKTPLRVFVPLSAVALLLTTTGFITAVHQSVLVGIALVAATLVALEKRLPPLAAGVLFAAAAIAIGLDSVVPPGVTQGVMKTLLGTWVSLVVVLLDVAIYVSFCSKRPWLKVGIRVLGSWIIAISLLVLAFSFRR